jgi:hypothetical protein
MAILGSLPSIEVTVWSGGDQLTEYDPPGDETHQQDKTVTKYIESVDDAEFFFKVEVSDLYMFGQHSLNVKYAADGFGFGGSILSRSRPVKKILGARAATLGEKKRTEDLFKFKFSALTIGKPLVFTIR